MICAKVFNVQIQNTTPRAMQFNKRTVEGRLRLNLGYSVKKHTLDKCFLCGI